MSKQKKSFKYITKLFQCRLLHSDMLIFKDLFIGCFAFNILLNWHRNLYCKNQKPIPLYKNSEVKELAKWTSRLSGYAYRVAMLSKLYLTIKCFN